MSRWLEIFKDDRLYEIEEGQTIKGIETSGKVRSLIAALQFTQIETLLHLDCRRSL